MIKNNSKNSFNFWIPLRFQIMTLRIILEAILWMNYKNRVRNMTRNFYLDLERAKGVETKHYLIKILKKQI